MAEIKAPQSSLKALIAKGKEQTYLTYAEVNDHLPESISDITKDHRARGKFE